MTTTLERPDLRPEVAEPLYDRSNYVVRWLNAWSALGAIVILVVIGYLVFISSTLATINSHLGATRASVTNAAGNTKTLPGQIETVNQNLTRILQSVSDLPGQASQIQRNLVSVSGNVDTTSTSLAKTAPRLVNVATNLKSVSSTLAGVSSNLTDTSRLLVTVLGSTSGIKSDLLGIAGHSSTTGVQGVSFSVAGITKALAGTEADLSDIFASIGSVNGHLHKVCKSAPINLLHGVQKC